MAKSLGAMVQPKIFGSQGEATTLLYMLLITFIWLSITGRLGGVRRAIAAGPRYPGEGTSEEHIPPVGQATGSEPPGVLLGGYGPGNMRTGWEFIDGWLRDFQIWLPDPLTGPAKTPPTVGTPPFSGPIINPHEKKKKDK